MHSLARNHALVDGNKRLAWAATRVFCLINGSDLTFTVDEAEELVLAVARGDLEVPEIAGRWRPISKRPPDDSTSPSCKPSTMLR